MEIKDNLDNRKIKIGILSKFLLGSCIIFYILSFINKNFILIYSNMTMFTIFWLEIYRLITGIFISDNLIELLLNIFIIIFDIIFISSIILK